LLTVSQKECQPITTSSKQGGRITRNKGKGKENDHPSSPFIDESEFDMRAADCGSSRRKEVTDKDRASKRTKIVERPRHSLHTPNRQNDRDQFSENDTFHTPNHDQSSRSYLLNTPNSQNNRDKSSGSYLVNTSNSQNDHDQFSESDDAEGSNEHRGAGVYSLLSFANFDHC
jgi:hypothetical protein